LIPPEVEVTGDDEVYSVEYIKDCCKRKRLQDLKPYRYEFSNMTNLLLFVGFILLFQNMSFYQKRMKA
jgi:hypothetical protein